MKEYAVHVVHNCIDHKNNYSMVWINAKNKTIARTKTWKYIRKYLFKDYDQKFEAYTFKIKALHLVK
jgi:hypothetical protein